MLTVYPYISRRKFDVAGRAGGVNVDNTHVVKTEAVGKSQSADSPYLFANEWIASSIAQFLRLPVPPFAIVRKKTRKTAMFISYSYDGDTKPDDVDPDALYQEQPFLCTGITLFDILIANCDRHGGNLKVDRPAKPKSCHIIDHERALFYIDADGGIKRLRSRVGRLGVTDGAGSGAEWHCLVERLDSIEHMSEWARRIQLIPDWFIDEVCEEMWKIALKRSEVEAVKEFLKRRRREISTLIVNHKARFTSIKKSQWPLFI